jgi:hypothetical protein
LFKAFRAHEIVLDKQGVPLRQGPSPLTEYGLVINQFSVTETEYDELSAAQFKAKQEAFLSAERSKAEREKEIQQKLMVEAKGLREAAEKTAEGNVKKAELEVAGEAKVAVAKQAKLEAETAAEQKKSVAKLEKEAAEIKATQEAEVARIAADKEKLVLQTQAEANKIKLITEANAAKEAASLQSEADKLKATGIVALAEAKQKEIQLGGAVTERDKTLAEIQANKEVGVATQLAQLRGPQNIIIGGSGDGKSGGASMQEVLWNMTLMRANGILDVSKSVIPAPAIVPAPAK